MFISLRTYLIILALLIVERVFELDRARRNARRAFQHGAVEVGQMHYRVMVAMHTLFIVSCAVEATFFPRAFPPAVAWIALTAELVAQALRYWAVATLGDRWNTRIIVSPDRAPATNGPYRFMRHPNYLAVVIEIAAVPMIGGAHLHGDRILDRQRADSRRADSGRGTRDGRALHRRARHAPPVFSWLAP